MSSMRSEKIVTSLVSPMSNIPLGLANPSLEPYPPDNKTAAASPRLSIALPSASYRLRFFSTSLQEMGSMGARLKDSSFAFSKCSRTEKSILSMSRQSLERLESSSSSQYSRSCSWPCSLNNSFISTSSPKASPISIQVYVEI